MQALLDTAAAAAIPSLVALGGYRYLAGGGASWLFAAGIAAAALAVFCSRRQREL